MPSIANQDFKIYGLLKDSDGYAAFGIPGKFCGELYAAFLRAFTSAKAQAALTDGFVFTVAGDAVCRLLAAGRFWYDSEADKIDQIDPTHENPAYYDALWAIQQAIYGFDESVVGEDLEFVIYNGRLVENSTGYPFINEDGYLIMATASDGKLASLSLGERSEGENPVVRLESLLPLVGELPLGTTEIW